MHTKKRGGSCKPLSRCAGGGERCRTITDCHTQRSERCPERCNTHRPQPELDKKITDFKSKKEEKRQERSTAPPQRRAAGRARLTPAAPGR